MISLKAILTDIIINSTIANSAITYSNHINNINTINNIII